MSRVESAAAGIVTECMLRGGRAMTLVCRMMDGQIWRVECERVDSEEEANITREQLRDALRVATDRLQEATQTIAEQLEASQAHRWVETAEAIKAGLRAIWHALGGEGDPENVKALVALAEKQIQLKRRAQDSSAEMSELNYQIYKALRAFHAKLGAPPSAADAGSLALIRDIDEHVQASFREMSEVRS
jgi:DNA repair ATPase RecN